MNWNSDWNRQSWDRRGRGGRGRGGPHRGNRGSWGSNNFRGPQSGFPQSGFPQSNRGGGGYWNKFNQDYSGPASRHANQQWQNRDRVKRDVPAKRLSEEDIGVAEFVSDHEGFNGIIKSRYSDFQVSEINEEGVVAKLTSVIPPEPPKETFDEDEDLILTKYNLEILPMDTWDKINKLVVSPESAEKVEIDVTGWTKEQRTKIHDAVKKAFGSSIVGSTETVGDKKFVCFDQYRKGVRVDNRVKWVWPGEYVYFIVHKENCDTMDAALRIAEALRINMKVSALGYAGTKDRRAKTSQWFSARRLDPRKLQRAADSPPLTRAKVRLGNYTFGPVPLKLGMLKGNRFRIALRNVTASEEEVSTACELLKTRGFINYYGLQRFGTRRDTPTYRVGLQLLQGNYKEAINSVVQEYQNGERRSHSGRVGAALQRAPHDYHGALMKIPRNTRLLYLHAYQSLIWNRCVTERLKRLGHTPAAGDLVPLVSINKEELDDDDSDEEEGSEEKETQQKEEKPESDVKTDAESQKEAEKEKRRKNLDIPKPKVPVKILTQEDVDSGKYTIFDIVMPLPGYNIDYPPNMKEYYEELLAKDGLKLDLQNKIKSYSMSGAYRHIVTRPLDMSWEIVRYSDPYADLILSDADQLDGVTTTGITPDGEYKALLLSMSLPASCYATMALRELLKVDTSGDNQALQNNYHKKNDKPTDTQTANVDTQPATDQQGATEDAAMDTESGKENGEKRKLEQEDTDAKKAKTDDSDKQ